VEGARFVLALNVLVGAVVSVALPDYGQMVYEGSQVWRGLQGHKNGFAFLSSLCFFSFLVRSLQGGCYLSAALAMCGISLLNIGMASSATSLFSLMLGAVCILFLRTLGGERDGRARDDDHQRGRRLARLGSGDMDDHPRPVGGFLRPAGNLGTGLGRHLPGECCAGNGRT
jgi:hypothetical protein